VIHRAASLVLALAATMAGSCAVPPPATPAVDSPPGEVTSSDVPEPFWDFDPASEFTINYADVDAILGAMVVNTGRSSREKLQPAPAQTGTRLKARIRRTTASEGNRFHFEAFKANEQYQQMLREVRQDLEDIPDQIALEYFTRDEQLAYWLNLYNIALLDQLVTIYPERNLEQELISRNSILDRKILNVADIPLSLNDIQHTILRWNYDNNPLVLYGLYQGVVGGPNIRPQAYTGERVNRDLTDNAKEFINSNRGTYYIGDDVFHVSGYYARNLGYFDDLDSHLRSHLLRYIEGPQKQALLDGKRLIADLEDWTITDDFGSSPRISGSFARNPAAVIGSAPMVDEVWLTDIAMNSEVMNSGSGRVGIMSAQDRFGPEAMKRLEEIRKKQAVEIQEDAE
jgi:hypothetical protein